MSNADVFVKRTSDKRYEVDPLPDDYPGRETYKCDVCGAQAEFEFSYKWDVTATNESFNGTSFLFPNLSFYTEETYACSDNCVNMWLMSHEL
jgi:hypothetical protein